MIDLHYELSCLTSKTSSDRVAELIANFKFSYNEEQIISMVAFGGFPFIYDDSVDNLSWCGKNVDKGRTALTSSVKEALGVSSLLTYTNPKNKTLIELGELCLEKNHNWALHWVSASILFVNFEPAVELAFARDTGFRLSWVVGETQRLFVATAGIKEWLGYLKHKDDKSFDKDTRVAMEKCHTLFAEILNG